MGKGTRSECRKFTRSVPLFSNQNGDRSRPTLFPGPCPLVPLEEIVSHCFAKVNSITGTVACSVGQESEGSRTIAILHSTYRLTMRLWDSALKDTSALRAHVARAAGNELAHREGQDVIRHAEIFDESIKAHLLIPQLVARGYLIAILALRTLTHGSPRCLQVGNGFSDVLTGCAYKVLAG